jgi:hypothetical protein
VTLLLVATGLAYINRCESVKGGLRGLGKFAVGVGTD